VRPLGIRGARWRNCDPFHLHVLDLGLMTSELKRIGFRIYKILGQPIANHLCARQCSLNDQNVSPDIDRAFRYDEKSILALSCLIAWPQEEDLEDTYSYFVVAQKCAS